MPLTRGRHPFRSSVPGAVPRRRAQAHRHDGGDDHRRAEQRARTGLLPETGQAKAMA